MRITPIEVGGHTYHLAHDDNVWREEARKRWAFYTDDYPDDTPWHWHHVAGRYGVLRLIIENSCPLLESLHVYEKCGDPKFSSKVHREAQRMIETYFSRDLYIQLLLIRKKEKFNPTKVRV